MEERKLSDADKNDRAGFGRDTSEFKEGIDSLHGSLTVEN